jgi:zinc transport system substrate-binding protein
MKKLLLLILITSAVYAKVDVVVSILPQKTFVKKITKDLANIHLLVKPGNSPHSYEPKPSQMVDISKSNLYFSIGVEFENVWLDRFKSQNKNLIIIPTDHGIKKISMKPHHHEEDHHDDMDHKHKDHDEHHEDEEHEHKGLDPHIWTSVSNVKIIAKNIYEAMIKYDPQNKNSYKKNYEEFLNELDVLDKKIKSILSNRKNDQFMVFHPAWGYFANEYGLTQLAIEKEGKSPKMKEIIALIELAKKSNIKAIFTHPEFSDKAAKLIAKESGAKVIKVSPLNPQWSNNMIEIAKAIAN